MHFGSGAPLGAHLRNRAWEGKSEGGRPRGHFGNKCARRVHLQINERHLHESATCDLEVSSLKLEPTELKRRWVAETARGTTRLPLPGIRNIQRHNPNTNIDHARTRTWNLRLRRPTPYPLGHATTHTPDPRTHITASEMAGLAECASSAWCSGYHICLTRRRSPVQSRALIGTFLSMRREMLPVRIPACADNLDKGAPGFEPGTC